MSPCNSREALSYLFIRVYPRSSVVRIHYVPSEGTLPPPLLHSSSSAMSVSPSISTPNSPAPAGATSVSRNPPISTSSGVLAANLQLGSDLPSSVMLQANTKLAYRGAQKRGCRLPVSRILSTPVLPGAGRSFLSTRLAPGAPLARSATSTRELAGGQPFPCYVLHHARFAVPSGYPDSRWALTPPFHPCLCLAAIGGIFLLHCLSGFLSSPVPHFHEARCPTVSGLSSTGACAPLRPPGRRRRSKCRKLKN